MKQLKILFFCSLIFLSCNENGHSNLSSVDSNDSLAVKRKEYADMIPVLDSLFETGNHLWKSIQKEKDTSLMINVNSINAKFNNYLTMFGALTEIHIDSLEVHAPLNIVNQSVDEFNTFCDSTTSGKHKSLPRFKESSEYIEKNNYYIAIILENRLSYLKEVSDGTLHAFRDISIPALKPVD